MTVERKKQIIVPKCPGSLLPFEERRTPQSFRQKRQKSHMLYDDSIASLLPVVTHLDPSLIETDEGEKQKEPRRLQ